MVLNRKETKGDCFEGGRSEFYYCPTSHDCYDDILPAYPSLRLSKLFKELPPVTSKIGKAWSSLFVTC